MLKDWNKPERPSDEEIDARLKIARENLTRNQIKVKEGKIPVFVTVSYTHLTLPTKLEV